MKLPFSLILWGMPQLMRVCALVYPGYAKRLKERNVIAQFRLQGKPVGRWIKLENGKISSRKGIHENPDISIIFKNKAIAEEFMTPPFDQLVRIDAAKNFKIGMDGSDELAVWFMSTLARMDKMTWKRGTDMGNGVTRYYNRTNGRPFLV